MATKAQIDAVNRFNKESTACVLLRLNYNTDIDILKKLDSVPSKMGYIKKLIRNDINTVVKKDEQVREESE